MKFLKKLKNENFQENFESFRENFHENYHENFTLLVDKSYYVVEEVFQINNEHISRKMKRCFFKLKYTPVFS